VQLSEIVQTSPRDGGHAMDVCVVGEVLVGPGELLERVALLTQGLEVLVGRGFVRCWRGRCGSA
jgi:hypothetical protein